MNGADAENLLAEAAADRQSGRQEILA